MPLFHISGDNLKQLNVLPISKEKDLRKLVEENLPEILDMFFLASEYPTTHGGRIDTLAIDSKGAPVIIEYKRNKHDNIITQSLFYLNWLKSQKREFFELLVIRKLGNEKAKLIDWKNPRVICIAESYNPYDLFALNEISSKLELHRYHYYENNIFTLENVKEDDERLQHKEQSATSPQITINAPARKSVEISLIAHVNKGQPLIKEIFFKLQNRIFELDENIQEKITTPYIGYKISKMFAEIHIQKNNILIYLRPIDYVDPNDKVSKVPDTHNWVLNRRVYINNEDDIDYIMKLIEQSYKDVL